MTHKSLRLIFMLLIFLTIVATGLCAPDSTDEGIVRQTSADYGTLPFKEGYLLINNTWNKGATTGPYRERIFVKKSDGQLSFGWDWEWPTSTTVVSYPDVIYGDSPLDSEARPAKGMPFRIGTRTVTVQYDVNLEGSGIFDMAFEFWAVSKVPAKSQDITHEVMIWNYNSGMMPDGRIIDQVTFDEIPYDVYLYDAHGDESGGSSVHWAYIAFKAQKPVLHGPLNISRFIDYLVAKGILNDKLYISSLEFGNEIVEGTGRAEILHYSVEVQ